MGSKTQLWPHFVFQPPKGQATWPVFLFPRSTVHRWMLGCLGSSTQATLSNACLEDVPSSTRGAFCVIWGVFLVSLLSVYSLVLTQRSCSDPRVYLLGYGIREERVIYISEMLSQSCSRDHTDAGGISPCKCLINVLLNCVMLSAGHLGQYRWLPLT